MAIQSNRAISFNSNGKQTTVPVDRPLPTGFEKIPGDLNTRELQQGGYTNITPSGTGPGSYLMGQPRQLNIQQGETQNQPQQVNPYTSFNTALASLLKQAQGGLNQGNQDLEAQRNALINARFNAATTPTLEELKVLSPSQQTSLRGSDTQGLDTQLAGVNTAIAGRKTEQTQNLAMLKAFQDSLKPDIQIISETDNDGNVSIISVDKATGNVVSQKTYEGIGKKAKEALPASYQEYQLAKNEGFKGTYNDYQTMDANRKRSISSTTNVYGGLNTSQFNRINTITDNSRQDPNISTFPAVRASFETARSSSTKKTSAGDIALMRMIAKITDPTTGVREEEYRTFQGAIGTLPAFGIQLTSQMIGRGQLTDYGRQQLMSIVDDIYSQRKVAYDLAYNQGLNQVKQQGGTAADFIPYVIAPESKKPANQSKNTNQSKVNDPLGIR